LGLDWTILVSVQHWHIFHIDRICSYLRAHWPYWWVSLRLVGVYIIDIWLGEFLPCVNFSTFSIGRSVHDIWVASSNYRWAYMGKKSFLLFNRGTIHIFFTPFPTK
jgi:hypothetical protein